MSDPRCFLYSPDCPKGRIFTGAEAIAAAKEDGWVDSPGAVEQPETKPPAETKPAASKKAGSKKAASKKKGGAKKVATGDNST